MLHLNYVFFSLKRVILHSIQFGEKYKLKSRYLLNTNYNYVFENQMTSHCTFFIKPSDNPPNLQQIKDKLAKGTIEQKCKYMKSLVKCLVSDQTYPPIIMHIISNIIPVQHKSPQLRKIMLLYWQVIDKCKSPTDRTIKQEIFLACNSLRNDLLCHNEYVRGRTLRLCSRIMHRGVIQPLASAISSNLQHKSSYVRRNTVICLYNVYNAFGSDIIGDIDDQIEELLQKQTDLSTKRNAFLLLNKSNPEKALKYLQEQMNFQTFDEIGDILQLAILKILKQKCKQDPKQKPKLLKIVKDFSIKSTQSVKLQCAITLTSISNSAMTIKSSLYSYINILAKTNELNVKKIILDKLQLICKNSNYLEEDLIQDLLKGLQTPSIDIKMKIIEIIITGITQKTSLMVLKKMQNQVAAGLTDEEYMIQLIKILEIMTFKFINYHEEVLKFIFNKLFSLEHLPKQGVFSLNNLLKKIFEQVQKKKNQQKQNQFKMLFLSHFDQIKQKQLIKVVLNIFGSYYNNQNEIEKVINKLKITIGALPINIASSKDEEQIQSEKKIQEQAEEKKIFKTVVLQDGSYSTELVSSKKIALENQDVVGKNKQTNYSFRNFIAQDSIVGGIFSRNISKLLYKIRKSEKTQTFNKQACSILMILCSIIRFYQENIHEVDQAIIEEISFLIKKIINPTQFIKSDDNNDVFNSLTLEQSKQPKYENFNDSEMIEKNPQDLINFRLLKKGGIEDIENEFQFDQEEINEIITEPTEEIKQKDYIAKLKSLVQLTGPFDPLYSEAFITVNKYDIIFEIFLSNNTKGNLSNIQIQFSSPVKTMVLQKAQSINLKSKETTLLRTQIRFIGSEFGVIYGYINYDNHAGLEQPYLITEQINIDYMQFIQPAKISEEDFKILWQKCQKESVFQQTMPDKNKNMTFKKIINILEKKLHAKCIQNLDNEQQEYFLNCHLYGKSKLGEDFMINVALFAGEEISSTITVKSKDQAVEQIINKEIRNCTFELDDEQEEN